MQTHWFMTGLLLAALCLPLHAQADAGRLRSWGGYVLPRKMDGKFISLRVNEGTAIAIQADGILVAWGNDAHGLVRRCPQEEFSQIAIGKDHAIALAADGLSYVRWSHAEAPIRHPAPHGSIQKVTPRFQLSEDGVLYALDETEPVARGVKNVFELACRLRPDFSYALWVLEDGSVGGRSLSGSGVPNRESVVKEIPKNLNAPASLALAEEYAIALSVDGSITAWTANSKQSIAIPAGLPPLKKIAATDELVVAIDLNGKAHAWNPSLWNPSPIKDEDCTLSVPENLPAITDVVADGNIAYAITESGQLRSWLSGGASHPLGPDSERQVASLSETKRLSLVTMLDGSLYVFRDNWSHGSALPFGHDWIAADISYTHGVSLRRDGEAKTWKHHSALAILAGEYAPHPTCRDLSRVVAGNHFSAALTKEGGLFIWGPNANFLPHRIMEFQIEGTRAKPPMSGFSYKERHVRLMITADGFKKIVSGGNFLLALNNRGVVYFGDPKNPASQVPELENVVEIAAGKRFGLALTAEGKVIEWGDTTDEDDIPKPEDLAEVTSIGANGTLRAALKRDGTIVTWGRGARLRWEDTHGRYSIAPSREQVPAARMVVGPSTVWYWPKVEE